jgi:hypothetical protein
VQYGAQRKDWVAYALSQFAGLNDNAAVDANTNRTRRLRRRAPLTANATSDSDIAARPDRRAASARSLCVRMDPSNARLTDLPQRHKLPITWSLAKSKARNFWSG